MKNYKLILLSIFLLGIFSYEMLAEIALEGKVTDKKTGVALVGAAVSIHDQSGNFVSGAYTASDGSFKLIAKDGGKFTLKASYLGYKKYNGNIDVSNNETKSTTIEMIQDVVGLEEVVVTGLASKNSKAIADVAVTKIDASDLTEKQNYTDFSQMITGKVPGVQMSSSSGNVGGGMRFQVRGGGGLNGNGQPVIYVDGVRINNSELGIDIGGQGYATLADLNPNDIESVQILKGPVGAALYGTQGSNGVVLITTKNGRRQKDFYSVNVKYTGGWNEQQEAYDPKSFLNADAANAIFSDGAIQEQGISVQGQSGMMNYFFGYSGRNEDGVLPGNSIDRQSLRGNFAVTPSSEFKLDVATNFVSTKGTRPINDNNITGWLGNVLLLDPVYSFTDSAAVSAIQDDTDNSRFIGSVAATYQPSWMPNLYSRLSLGMDYSNFVNENLYSPDFVYSGVASNGAKHIYNQRRNNFNMDFSVGYNWNIGEDIGMETVVGSQLFTFTTNTTEIIMQDFPSSNLTNLLSGLTYQTADDYLRNYREAGIFIRQDFNYKNYLFVTAAVRQDYSSVLGEDANRIMYPRLSGALRLDELMNTGDLNMVKFRAGWGQSGQLPGLTAAQALRWGPLNAGAGVGAQITSIGNPNITPERINEIEIGFELEYQNAYGVDFTYYMQNANESIINLPNPPSSGLTATSVPTNIGEIKSWGFESMFYATPIMTEDYQLDLRFILNMQENEIVSLGGTQPQIVWDIVGWYEGLPRSAFYGRKVNGALFDEDGNYAGVDATADNVLLGTPLPRFTGSFNVSFRFLKDFTLTTLLDFAQDVYTLNYTRRYQALFGTDVEVNELNEQLATQTPGTAEYIATANKLAKLSPSYVSNYAEEASWMKLREISLRYDATRMFNKIMNRKMVNDLSLVFSVRNVAIWSPYNGIDPEVNTQGSRTNIGRNVDFLTLATPRTFNFTINLGL